MSNEEKTWNQLIYELAKLIKELKEDYEIDGVRCSISIYKEKKAGVLICGKNGAKKSLALHWHKVNHLILSRIKALCELSTKLADKDAYVGRILSWKDYLFIRPIPILYKDEWLGKYAVIKIIDGVLAGTLIIARVIRYPSRNDYGIVFKLSRKLYKSIAKHKGEVVRFKILDVIDENQSVAH